MTIQRGTDAAQAGGRDAPGPSRQAAALLQRAIAELTDPQSGGYGRRSVEVVVRDHKIVSIELQSTDTHKV